MRALIRFDCFGVIFMTMIFTSFVRFLEFNYSVVFSESRFSVPAPESHRSVASLAPVRAWQSHIQFGSLFSFQGTMKRSFTYSHWQRSNTPLNGEIFTSEKTSSLIWTKGAEMHTQFQAFSEKTFLENLSLHLFSLGSAELSGISKKFFIW